MSKTPLTAEEIQEINHLHKLVEAQQYYTLLGVARSSESSTIQQAYYKLSRKWHPDAYFRRDVEDLGDKIDRIFMGLTEAYQILSDPKSRQSYDRKHPVQSIEKQTTETPSDSGNNNSSSFQHRKGRRRRERERERAQSENEDKVESQSIRDRLKQQRQSTLLNQVSSTVGEQKRKAQSHFDEGTKHYKEGRVMQAATEMHLACKLDPENEQFKNHFRVVRREARAVKAQEFITAAENAEAFSNFGRAIEQYRKAVSYECESPVPYARLAYLLAKLDPDPREILRLLQIAVQKDPNNPEYHCLLGEAYFRQDMTLNAKREFEAAIALKKDYQRAIDGLKIL